MFRAHPIYMKTSHIISILMVASLTGLTGCSRCQTIDDETAIRQVIEQGVADAEASRAKAVMTLATRDFELIPQGFDVRDTQLRLYLILRRLGRFSIIYPRPTILIDAKTQAFAEAQMPFAIRRTDKEIPNLSNLIDDPEEWISEIDAIADVYTLEMWLIKKDDTWKVRKARIQ